MLYNHDFKNIAIDTYTVKIFQAFMLEARVYVT